MSWRCYILHFIVLTALHTALHTALLCVLATPAQAIRVPRGVLHQRPPRKPSLTTAHRSQNAADLLRPLIALAISLTEVVIRDQSPDQKALRSDRRTYLNSLYTS